MRDDALSSNPRPHVYYFRARNSNARADAGGHPVIVGRDLTGDAAPGRGENVDEASVEIGKGWL
jgi:hypothetical protein